MIPPLMITTTLVNAGVIVATVLLSLAVGLEVDRRAIGDALRRRGALVLLWAFQTIVPPAVALLIVSLLELPFAVAAGLLVLAACPVGDIASAYTLLARGPVALSLSINVFSCLTAPLTMALTFHLYAHVLDGSFVFTLPTPFLMTRVFLLSVLPVVAGMAWRVYFPAAVERLGPWVRRTCLVSMVTLVLYVLASRREQLWAESGAGALAALLFLGVSFAAGWWAGRMLRLPTPVKATASFITGVRNLGMLAAVSMVMMGQVEYALFGAVYFLIEVPLALWLVRLVSVRRRDGNA
jgi:bile acid:Na+ symporter, BASS family